MIMQLFILLVVISLFLVFLGYYVDNPTLGIVGFFFLFLLGNVVWQGNLQIGVGEVEDTVYFYDNSSVNQTIMTKTVVHEAFNDTAGTYALGISMHSFFGVWLSIIGVFGMIMTLVDVRSRRKQFD